MTTQIEQMKHVAITLVLSFLVLCSSAVSTEAQTTTEESSARESVSPYKPMARPFVTWVDNTKPMVQIVSDSFDGKGRKPAAVLVTYLEKITGTKIPVRRVAKPNVPTIYLGPKAGLTRLGEASKRLELGNEGFVIRSQGDDLMIAGRSRLGTLFGVYAFLEEYLGVRWLWPGELGEVCPQRTVLKVGRIDSVQVPHFRKRWVINRFRDSQWALQNRTNCQTGDPDEFVVFGQPYPMFLDLLLPPEKHLKKHPEYYAMILGQRPDPNTPLEVVKRRRWQICLSNPEVLREVVSVIDEAKRRNPRIRMTCLTPEDSNHFCECEQCRSWDDPRDRGEAKYSRRYLTFANRVAVELAKQHPDLIVEAKAYSAYNKPPGDRTLPLHDNVAISMNRFMCHNHAIGDPSCPVNREIKRRLDGWQQMSNSVSIHEYWKKISWRHLPWPIIHTMKQDFPDWHTRNIFGTFTIHGASYAANGLVWYVGAKLLWNADLDVDALVRDYCEKAYADAAAPMVDYYQRLERAAIESGVHLAYADPEPEIVAIFTPCVIADLQDAIERARTLVRDERARARIEMVGRTLEYTIGVAEYLRIIDEVARRSPLSGKWIGARFTKNDAKAVLELSRRATAIREFLEDPRNQSVSGENPRKQTAEKPGGRGIVVNSYVANMLRPDRVLRYYRALPYPPHDMEANKKIWLTTNPGESQATLTKEFDLWIYAYDIDFDDGKPEHTVSVIGAKETEVLLGGLGSVSSNGNTRQRGFKVTGLSRTMIVDGKLRFVLKNSPGGGFTSHFLAFYVVPSSPNLDEDQVTRQIQTNIEAVRSRSFGFTEFDFFGVSNDDGERTIIEIDLPAPRDAP